MELATEKDGKREIHDNSNLVPSPGCPCAKINFRYMKQQQQQPAFFYFVRGPFTRFVR